MDEVDGLREVRLRYPATCSVCGCTLPARSKAWWDTAAKRAYCGADAGATAVELAAAEVPQDATTNPEPPEPAEAIRGEAGASAQREWQRRKARRSERVLAQHPRLGRLLLALVDDPQSTRAWKTGADGERILAERLGRLTERGIVLLHDRRMPGSRANIDHIAVTPTGTWVIDAKRYSGKVEKRDVGGWFRKDERLFVAGRDQTRLIDGAAKQVQAVRAVLEDAPGASAQVRAILCFVGAEWSLFARPFTLNETLVTWPASLIGLLESEGTLSGTEIQTISSSLADRLRPA